MRTEERFVFFSINMSTYMKISAGNQLNVSMDNRVWDENQRVENLFLVPFHVKLHLLFVWNYICSVVKLFNIFEYWFMHISNTKKTEDTQHSIWRYIYFMYMKVLLKEWNILHSRCGFLSLPLSQLSLDQLFWIIVLNEENLFIISNN